MDAFFKALLCRLVTIGLLLPMLHPAADADQLITSAAEVRALSPEAAGKAQPVKIRGFVPFVHPQGRALFLHDGVSGVFVEQPDHGDLVWPAVGDAIEVTGVTGEGLFAPVIRGIGGGPPGIGILGHDALPEPRLIGPDELERPDLDCDWVKVETHVREVLVNSGQVILECQTSSCDFHVLIEGPLPPESVPWDLAECRVQVRGVAATIFNTSRQMTRRFLRVNSLADVVRLDPPGRPAEPRLVRVDDLFRFTGAGPHELVRVRGAVTMVVAGSGFFLRTEGGGLWVQTAQPLAAEPGSIVEADGWPRVETMKPILRALGARVVGAGEIPRPLAFDGSEVLHAQHQAELVSLDAELLDVFRGNEGTTLELRDRATVFRCLLDSRAGGLPELVPGSRVRVNGIAQISSVGEFDPIQEEDKLLLLLRSPADVEVLALPPWWTTPRVIMASAAIIACLLAIYARNRTRRRRKQEAQRREFEAVLAERGRFAREIHDSLAQGLTSISLQLECVRDEVATAPDKARLHLENARSLVRDSLREARRTVWNLRPLALGEADLVTALQRFASDLTRDGKIAAHQEIEGRPRPLPLEHENALLRIGQEALTNAVRYSAATRIVLRLRFGDDWVTLNVRDDGRGFDVAERVGKGFGITGMHERVAALGGSLTIDSRPGEGTEVSATLPT
jgi:signal transduction histidine kinase